MSTVANLPVWKINSTPIEKLREVLQYAESHPEDINDLIVLWLDADKLPQWQTSKTVTLGSAIFLLEKTKLEMLT